MFVLIRFSSPVFNFLIPIAFLLLSLLFVSGCAKTPHLDDSRAASSAISPSEFAAAGRDAVTVNDPQIRTVKTPKTGRVGVDPEPIIHPPVKPGFNFDNQLRRIASATEASDRERLTLEYLMQAWNLGPGDFEKALKRLGNLQLKN